jgi:hypothetical protein
MAKLRFDHDNQFARVGNDACIDVCSVSLSRTAAMLCLDERVSDNLIARYHADCPCKCLRSTEAKVPTAHVKKTAEYLRRLPFVRAEPCEILSPAGGKKVTTRAVNYRIARFVPRDDIRVRTEQVGVPNPVLLTDQRTALLPRLLSSTKTRRSWQSHARALALVILGTRG